MAEKLRLYRVGKASPYATYGAGTYVAASPEEAVEKARADYRRSETGRALHDVGAFRFYIQSSAEVRG